MDCQCKVKKLKETEKMGTTWDLKSFNCITWIRLLIRIES